MNQIVSQVKELSTIIVALISGISILLVAYINKYHERKLKEKEWERDEAKKEAKKAKVELNILTLFFSYDLYEFIDEKVHEIFNSTKVTRFLIVFAINGKEDFNTVTVVYEHTKDTRSKGAIRKYIRTPIDIFYRDMLKATERYGYYDIITDKLPKDSILYKTYTNKDEQVKYSRMRFINRLHIDESNDLLLYASIGTHDLNNFTDEEINIIDSAVNEIRTKSNKIKIQ